jgi:hypothetical protein
MLDMTSAGKKLFPQFGLISQDGSIMAISTKAKNV